MTDENARSTPQAPGESVAAEPEATVPDDARDQADREVQAASVEAESTDVAGDTDDAQVSPAVEPAAGTGEERADAAPPKAAADDAREGIVEGETDVAEPADVLADASAEATASPASEPRADHFQWHPEYRGSSFDEVRAALAAVIAADQRQHRLAMDGAEESEQEALASVVSLERKWGPYDFDWAEQNPDHLAGRILAFEQERERRQELISWADYRAEDGHYPESTDQEERPAELSSGTKAMALLLVVLLIVVILLAVWAL